jgi:Fe-S-cluster containining protein
LAPHKGCTIYPYRPRYCRGYECDKLKAEFGEQLAVGLS